MTTFREEIEKFVTDANKEFSPSTQEHYRIILGRLVGWMEKEKKTFDQLTTADARRFIAEQGWAENLAYSASVTIRSFAIWSCGQGHQLTRFRIRKPSFSPQRTLTKDQAEMLLSTLAARPRPEDKRNFAMVALMLDTGLRSSEVCRLQLNRLDLENRTLTVLGKGTKGGKWRSCVFSEKTRELLRAWLDIREKQKIIDAGYVFIGINGLTKGGRMTPGGLKAIFRKMAERAGLPGLSPHDLRRSMATIGIQNGAPSRLIQKQGGWESLDLLERYTQALRPHDVDAFLPMGSLKVSGPVIDLINLKPAEPRTPEVLMMYGEMQKALQGLADGSLHVVRTTYL